MEPKQCFVNIDEVLDKFLISKLLILILKKMIQ